MNIIIEIPEHLVNRLLEQGLIVRHEKLGDYTPNKNLQKKFEASCYSLLHNTRKPDKVQRKQNRTKRIEKAMRKRKELANYTCEFCGSTTGPMVASHIGKRMRSNPNFKPDSVEDIFCLCEPCDKAFDRIRSPKKKVEHLREKGKHKEAEKIERTSLKVKI